MIDRVCYLGAVFVLGLLVPSRLAAQTDPANIGGSVWALIAAGETFDDSEFVYQLGAGGDYISGRFGISASLAYHGLSRRF